MRRTILIAVSFALALSLVGVCSLPAAAPAESPGGSGSASPATRGAIDFVGTVDTRQLEELAKPRSVWGSLRIGWPARRKCRA